jgi:hypothetical protein
MLATKSSLTSAMIPIRARFTLLHLLPKGIKKFQSLRSCMSYLFDIPYGILFGCNGVGFFALGV